MAQAAPFAATIAATRAAVFALPNRPAMANTP